MTLHAFQAFACDACGGQVAPGLLACPGCGRLVHRVALLDLARAAEAAERAGDFTTALAAWRRVLELLPAGTVQRSAIERRMAGLSAAVDGRAAPAAVAASPGASNARRAGAAAGLGAVGLALLKSKALLTALASNAKLLAAGLTKLPTLLSMLVYARWTSGSGAGFALGLVASIYVHEIGHVAALRRYGIDASAPMFVPGLGAFVRMNQYPTDAHEEARTGLAGPLWGLVAAFVSAVAGRLFASPIAVAVASVAATINLFNLLPVWQLDGARGLRALAMRERVALAAIAGATALVAHQWMPALIAAVTAARARSADAHPTGDRRMLALFSALVVALAALAALPVRGAWPVR